MSIAIFLVFPPLAHGGGLSHGVWQLDAPPTSLQLPAAAATRLVVTEEGVRLEAKQPDSTWQEVDKATAALVGGKAVYQFDDKGVALLAANVGEQRAEGAVQKLTVPVSTDGSNQLEQVDWTATYQGSVYHCQNHDPAHEAYELEEMQRLKKEEGCESWKRAGG